MCSKARYRMSPCFTTPLLRQAGAILIHPFRWPPKTLLSQVQIALRSNPRPNVHYYSSPPANLKISTHRPNIHCRLLWCPTSHGELDRQNSSIRNPPAYLSPDVCLVSKFSQQPSAPMKLTDFPILSAFHGCCFTFIQSPQM